MSTVNHSAANGIHPGAYVQSGDPGAVGANVLWIDTTGGATPYPIKKRNSGNTGWDVVVPGIFGASGGSHAAGLVPDPGSSAGSTHFLCENGTFAVPSGSSGLYSAVAIIQDQKSSGTAGGTASTGAWRTRDLNTKVADTGGNVTVSSNQMAVLSGTYDAIIVCPTYNTNYSAIRLQNITDSSTIASGGGIYLGGSTLQGIGILTTEFTIAATKTLEVQHQVQTGQSTNGWGVAIGSVFTVGVEVYTQVILLKH